jgi:hypothetical protein
MPTTELRMEARFRTLEVAVKDLTGNVHRLVEALQVVGQLSAAQQEQAARQSATEELAVKAQALSRTRDRAVRRVQRLTSITVAIAVPTVSLLAYWTLTVQVSQQFSKVQNDLTTSCLVRNQTNVVIPQRRDQAIADAYTALRDPVMAKIYQDSANALSKSAADCSIYKRVTK